MCSYKRLRGFGGSIGEIISEEQTGSHTDNDSPMVVTILPTDKGFEFTAAAARSSRWRSNASVPAGPRRQPEFIQTLGSTSTFPGWRRGRASGARELTPRRDPQFQSGNSDLAHRRGNGRLRAAAIRRISCRPCLARASPPRAAARARRARRTWLRASSQQSPGLPSGMSQDKTSHDCGAFLHDCAGLPGPG
jgi:hypothetical protein